MTEPFDIPLLVLQADSPAAALRRLDETLVGFRVSVDDFRLARRQLVTLLAFGPGGSVSDRAEPVIDRSAEISPSQPQRLDSFASYTRPELPRELLFLGRGVSERLSDHRRDVEKMQQIGAPVLHSPADLADRLGLTVSRLGWLAYHTEVATRIHYVLFQVPRRRGGTRPLARPHKTLASVQQWILVNLLARLPLHDACHGFTPGRSIVSNATAHAGQDVVINLDLKDFFPSVGFARVRRVFEVIGYSSAVATVLALLCTECPRRPVEFSGTRYWVATGPRGLPQGACTSPALANQVAWRLDRRLSGLAASLGLRYTRYADDLTFSGPLTEGLRIAYVIAKAERIILDEGFTVNRSKTRVLRRNARQTVTGLVVNERPSPLRRDLRRLRAILHRAKTEGLEAQNRDSRPNFRAWLRGKIAFVHMSRPDVAKRLLAELDALDEERSEGERGA